ncbi:MAG: four helix bundle protein [Kofleriaceae bacterium]
MQDAHPFAVHFRDDNPHSLERAGVYEQALALTSAVDAIVEKSEARFHLKDLLDKSATMVALRIAQAAGETAKGDRRKHYRIARRAATDCAAILDILGRRPGCDAALIAPARTIILALVMQLAHLATR